MPEEEAKTLDEVMAGTDPTVDVPPPGDPYDFDDPGSQSEPEDRPSAEPAPAPEPAPAGDTADSGMEDASPPPEGQLIARAFAAGLDPLSFSNREALEQRVNQAEQHRQQSMSQPTQNYPQPPQWQQPQQPTPQYMPPMAPQYPANQAPPQPPTNQPPQQADPWGFKLAIPEDIDEEFREQLESMNQHYSNVVGQLRGQVEQVVSRNAAYEAQQVEKVFDDYISNLGDEWKDIFGDGRTASMQHMSPEWINRQRLLGQAQALAGGYSMNPNLGPPPTVPQLLDQARGAAFGDRIGEIQRKFVSSRLRNRSGQFVARPTHRDGQKPTTEEDSVKAARDWAKRFVRERGYDEDGLEP